MRRAFRPEPCRDKLRVVRVVCAPNAFKGTLSAGAAARALAAGVRDAGGDPVLVPMADGGDGTLDVLLAAAATPRVERHLVSGPRGGRAAARVGWTGRGQAVIELADAAGLRRLHGHLSPLRATSAGVGRLVSLALDGGAERLIIGVGGSACTDGGAGIISSLGGRLLDVRGRPVPPGGGGLTALAAADLSGLDRRLEGCRVEVAVDVDTPLLGEHGAARIFGPQKGAGPDQMARLEDGLAGLAQILERDAGVPVSLRTTPGAGAAGGCGYGLAAIGARLLPGAALVADSVGLDEALAAGRLAITGEGRLDAQTARGKAPAEVAARAAAAHIPCMVVAGLVESVPEGFAGALALGDIAVDGENPMRVPRRLLRRAAAALTQGADATG